jgi:hypothetical protein
MTSHAIPYLITTDSEQGARQSSGALMLGEGDLTTATTRRHVVGSSRRCVPVRRSLPHSGVRGAPYNELSQRSRPRPPVRCCLMRNKMSGLVALPYSPPTVDGDVLWLEVLFASRASRPYRPWSFAPPKWHRHAVHSRSE